MRSKRLYVAGAMAGALALAVSGAAVGAAGDAVQTIDAKVSPKKLPRADLAPVELEVTTETYYEGADGGEEGTRIPPKTTKAKIFLADNLDFNTAAAKRCTADISTMSADEARAACKKAQVGTGSATAALPLGPGGARVNLEAVVTAFNGKPASGKSTRAAGLPTILLHAYIGAVDTTTVLTGVLRNARGDFGHRLDVDVPALAGGAGAIRDFNVAVKRADYVQGTCPPKDRTMHFKGVFVTSDAGKLTATDEEKCGPKK